MKRVVVLLTTVVVLAAALPAAARADDPRVLCGNFGGQTEPPRLANKPGHCEVTRLDGVPEICYLRKVKWTRWDNRGVGRGLVDGRRTVVRLKKTRPCGRFGEYDVYSEMSIGGRPFRPIRYCGD